MADIDVLTKAQSTSTTSELLALLIQRVQERADPTLISPNSPPQEQNSFPQPHCQLIDLLAPESEADDNAAVVLGHFVDALRRLEETDRLTHNSLLEAEPHLFNLVQSALRGAAAVKKAEFTQTAATLEARGVANVCLTVAAAWETTGQHWDFVFVPGSSRGKMPGRNMKGPLPLQNDVRLFACELFDEEAEEEEAEEDDGHAIEWWREPEHLEKERRLFHTACTRATNTTYVTCSQCIGGKRTTIPPSPFVLELIAAGEEVRTAIASEVL